MSGWLFQTQDARWSFQTQDVSMVVPDTGCQDGSSRRRLSGWLLQTQDVRMVAPDAGCQDGCSRCRMSGWLFQMQDGCSRCGMVAPDAGCQHGCSSHRDPQQSGPHPTPHPHPSTTPPLHQHEQHWSVPTKVEVHSQWMGTRSSSKSTTTFSSSTPDLSNPLPKR